MWGSRVEKGCRGGWSETPSDRIVDGIGMSCIWAGGSVAGFSGIFGDVWRSSVWRDLDLCC